MKMPGRSRASAGLASSLPLLVLLVVSVWRGPLTDQPSGDLPALALGIAVMAVVAAALVSALARWLPSGFSRASMALAGGLGAAGASAVLTAGSTWLLVVPVVAVLWGWVVANLHGLDRPSIDAVLSAIPERDRLRSPRSSQGDSAGRDESGMGQPRGYGLAAGGDKALWRMQAASRRMAFLTLFGAVVFAAIVLLSIGRSPTWWLIVAGLLGVAFCGVTAAWSRIEVQVDHFGLQIRSLVLRMPLVTVPSAQILGVASAEVDPLAYGGWGLRWSARHTAFILHGGPGLVVWRASGRQLVIETPSGSDCADDGARAVRTAVISSCRPI